MLDINKGVAFKDSNGIWRQNGKIIPKELVPRFIIHSHIISGNSSIDAAMHCSRDYEYSMTLEVLKKELAFIKQVCLHCDKQPNLMRRDLNDSSHVNIPSRTLRMDCLYVKEGYILTLVDDFSRKLLLLSDSAEAWPAIRIIRN